MTYRANRPHPRETELGGFHLDVLQHHINEFKARAKERPELAAEMLYRIKRFREYARWRRQNRIDDYGNTP